MNLLAAAGLIFLAPALAAVAGGNPYDEKADAKAEIKQALTAATTAKIPVIVVFGANWCPDCRELDLAMHRGATAQLLAGHFEIVKVNVGGRGEQRGTFAENGDLARLYGVPLEKGIPALAILSAGNAVLYATHEGELADARTMGDQGIYDFFKRVIDSGLPKQ
jgi:thioredoxin 1